MKQDRMLSVVVGREMAPPADCITLFVYLPPSPAAPPLLFAESAPPAIGVLLRAQKLLVSL